MADEQESRSGSGLGLSLTNVAAGALAAASSAVAASTLGVAGTVVGAALGSVVATTATAVYLHSFERTRDSWRGTRTDEVPDAPRAARRLHPAAAAGVAFGLALGGITALELASGNPVASTVRWS